MSKRLDSVESVDLRSCYCPNKGHMRNEAPSSLLQADSNDCSSVEVWRKCSAPIIAATDAFSDFQSMQTELLTVCLS
jgi:hypothetical protein